MNEKKHVYRETQEEVLVRTVNRIISIRVQGGEQAAEGEEKVKATLFGSQLSNLMTAPHACEAVVLLLRHGKYYRDSMMIQPKWAMTNLLGTFGGVSLNDFILGVC